VVRYILEQQAVIAAKIGVLQRAQHAWSALTPAKHQRGDAEIAQDAVEFGNLEADMRYFATWSPKDRPVSSSTIAADQLPVQALWRPERQGVAKTMPVPDGLRFEGNAGLRTAVAGARFWSQMRHIRLRNAGNKRGSGVCARTGPTSTPIWASQPSGWQKSFCMSITTDGGTRRSIVSAGVGLNDNGTWRQRGRTNSPASRRPPSDCWPRAEVAATLSRFW